MSTPVGRMMIVGASRGIGGAMAERFELRVAQLSTVSRSPAPRGRWLPCDVSDPRQIAGLAQAFGDGPLDALLILGGTWEEGAFTDAYSFEASSAEETANVVAVNLVAPILLVQVLLPNLRRSDNPRVVVVGSLSALDNRASREVANSASKYGLRGAVQAMALALRPHRIGFTVVNPGNVATPEVIDDIEAGRFGEQVPIAMDDLAAAIDCALAMSPASTIAEINIEQRRPGDGSD